jgi:hypothetical protein
MIVHDRTKMRSANSLFKNRPGASKIVVQRRNGCRNTVTGLPGGAGVVHRKPVTAYKYQRSQVGVAAPPDTALAFAPSWT